MYKKLFKSNDGSSGFGLILFYIFAIPLVRFSIYNLSDFRLCFPSSCHLYFERFLFVTVLNVTNIVLIMN